MSTPNFIRIEIEGLEPFEVEAGTPPEVRQMIVRRKLAAKLIETPEQAAQQAGSALSRFMDKAAQQINPVPLINAMITDPKGTIGGIGKQIFSNGSNPAQVPLRLGGIGEMLMAPIKQAGEEMSQGNIAGGMGTLTGAALPYALGAARNINITPKPNLNPVQQSAVAYGMRQGIPLDLAERTNASSLQGIKRGLQHIPGAAGIGDEARAAQIAAMTGDINSLGQRIIPSGTTDAYQAGQLAINEMGKAVPTLHNQATAEYTALRKIAEQNAQTVQIGEKSVTSKLVDKYGNAITRIEPVTTRLRGSVDAKPFKKEVAPILDEIEGKLFVNIGPDQLAVAKSALMQNNPTYAFLRQIMDGPDMMDIASADTNLSYLKYLARNTDSNPIIANAMRSRSEGLAARAIPDLSDAVNKGVLDLGKEAVQHLVKGRELTKQKYQLADVVEQLKREPVQAFKQAAANHDYNLDLLKNIEKNAPAAIPGIARAYLEGIIVQSSPSGVVRAPGLLVNWERLGEGTKKILYGDKVKDIEDAFQLANHMRIDANPSGTAPVGAALNLMADVFTAPVNVAARLLGARQLAKSIYYGDRLSIPTARVGQTLSGIGLGVQGYNDRQQ